MSFLQYFKNLSNLTSSEAVNCSELEKIMQSNFPEFQGEDLAKFSCVAGLLTRLAYVDLEISPEEQKSIVDGLVHFLSLDKNIAEKIKNLAVQNTVQLKGLQNHRFSKVIIELMDKNERYKLLELLFAVAASDGNADQLESEEIRVITKELRLEHQHYISARASVLKHLSALRKD